MVKQQIRSWLRNIDCAHLTSVFTWGGWRRLLKEVVCQIMDSYNTSTSHLFCNIKRGRYTFVLALSVSSAIDKLSAVCNSLSAPTFPVPGTANS